jgi:exo-beta-1,3-glucanase (GH17 family)
MWMAGYNEPGNQAQIALGVALAKSYPDIVVAVSVGNESLVNWSDHAMKPAVLASHIAYVRSQITQPVTTDDNWAYYADADRAILDVIDFASVHTYAMVDTHYNPTFWDWKQTAVAEGPDRAVAMMKAAMDSTKKDYTAARSFVDSKGYSALPMIVGETGWMAKDASGGAHWYKFLAHPVNQKMYFDSLQAWWSAATGPKAVFYFEAFDEQWKGSDDNWGLFNRLREARYAIQSAHAQSDTFKYEPGSYTAADALYFKLPTVHSAVTDNNYVIYSETVTGFVPTGLRWDPFANTFWQSVADAAPGDGTQSYEIDPRPETWGWGMLYQSAAVSPAPAVTENLSQFAAGSLNVYIKTSYGSALNEKIEIGISSDTDLDGAQEAFLQISNGQYGFCNTGNWCKVTIPLRDFVAANPKLDLRLVLSRFMIADRFAFTGNTTHTGLPKIKIDAVYWSK